MNRFRAVLLLMVPVILFAQPAPDTLWTRTFGGAGDDVPRAIRQTSDGGYVITGLTNSFGNGGYDIYVAKLDSQGNLEWQRTYGGPARDVGNDVRELSDGEYAVVGGTFSAGSTESGFILRLTAGGDSLWMRTYQADSTGEFLIGVVQLGDSSLEMIGGIAQSVEHPFYQRVLRRTTLLGDIISVRIDWGVIGAVYMYNDIEPTHDGGAIIGGDEFDWYIMPHGGIARWQWSQLWCLDSTGVTLWARQLAANSASNDNNGTIAPLPDGSCLVHVQNNRVERVDSASSLWSCPRTDYFVDLRAASQGAGFASLITITGDGNDIRLAGCSSNGALLWQGTWGGPGDDQAIALESTSDSGYVIVGTTTSFGAGGTDIYVIKTDPHHWLNAGERRARVPEEFALSAYPNPFNPSTTLSFSLAKAERAKLAVYNVEGRLVKVLMDEMAQAGEHRMVFDGSNLSSGIYFARLEAAEMTTTKKIMLLK